MSKQKGWNFDTEIVTVEKPPEVQEFGMEEEQPKTKISWLSSSEP